MTNKKIEWKENGSITEGSFLNCKYICAVEKHYIGVIKGNIVKGKRHSYYQGYHDVDDFEISKEDALRRKELYEWGKNR